MRISNTVIPAILLLAFCTPAQVTAQSVEVESVKMITGPAKNHFFGYYGINVWNEAKTHILALETEGNDKLPQAGEPAVIGLVEIATSTFTPLTRTHAWNLQQGCMMFWNPFKPSEEFYFNDIVDDKLVSILYNIPSGTRTVKPYTISGLSPDGRKALHMNYGRISRLRKVVSYGGTTDPNPTVAAPDNDGIFIVDLQTDQARLLVSYGQMARDIATYAPEIADRHMWNEHAEFSPSGDKVLFLPRSWGTVKKKLETGLYTIHTDGTGMTKVIPYGNDVSHFGWRNENEIIVTYNFDGQPGRHQHVLVNDRGKPFTTVGNMNWDGHCSFVDGGEWVLSDRKDMKNFIASIWMCHLPTNQSFELRKFNMLEERFIRGDTRCDPHPRISDDKKMVCIDAIDPQTGLRQIFILYIKLK